MSSDPVDLTSVLDAVRSLAAPSPGQLSDGAALAWLDQVEQLGRRVDALRVQAAAEIGERSRRELGADSLARRHGVQSAGALIERVARVSSTEASRRIRLGSDTAARLSLGGQPMPARFDHVARALDEGAIGVDAALAIVRNLAAAERGASFDGLEAAETHLVEQAREVSADLVALEARAWRTALDPDGTEPRDAELRGRRRLVLGREVDGMTPFWGEADPVSASQLRTWLAERTAPDRVPRFLDPEEASGDAASDPIRDPRSRDQRQFDVLMGLLLSGIRAETEIRGARHGAANVMVVVQETVITTGRGTAWLSDSTEPISAASAAALACDSGIQKIYLGPGGEPLALGRRERFHTAAQRKAMVVRDGGGCAWPECTAPPSWTHAHHPRRWGEGGHTDVDNGVLLCPFHHRLVHEGRWQITMREGLPYLRAPLELDLSGTWRRMGRRRPALVA